MTTARDDSITMGLRRATLGLGAAVALYVPVMQVIVDRTLPALSKPAVAGIVSGLVITCFCLLPRHWHVRLLLMAFMGLITLGLAEVACRFLLGSATASIYDWDDVCLYKTRPNSHKVYRRLPINGGQSNTVSINSQSFRGPELPPPSAGPRIILYGDSFIEAEYSAFENTFGEQLRQIVTTAYGRPVTVINAGTNGYGPDQELLRMESELATIQPQVVVLSIFADNDYGDLLRNKLFRLNDQGELISNAWTRSAACLHPGLRGRYEPSVWKLAREAIRGAQSRSGVVESFMERWRLQCQAEYDEYIVRRNSEVHDLQADHYDADLALTPGVPAADYKVRLFAAILQRIDATCRKHHAKLLVMVIPSPADLIENYDFCAIDHQHYPQYESHALTNVAANAARAQHVPCVNLYDPFAKQAAPSSLYFRGGDNHWNDVGQKLAAKVLAPSVVKLLPPVPR